MGLRTLRPLIGESLRVSNAAVPLTPTLSPRRGRTIGRLWRRKPFVWFVPLHLEFGFSSRRLRSKLILDAASKLATVFALVVANGAFGFEGRIAAVLSKGNETVPIAYTVGTNMLRIESTGSNQLSPVDILDLQSGTLTLLFPHNRSFVRVKRAGLGVPSGKESNTKPVALAQESKINLQQAGSFPPGVPASALRQAKFDSPTRLPPGFEPQDGTVGAGPATVAPAMLEASAGMLVLQTTQQKTNILGFACRKYELKRQGETLEIWATDELIPFQAYVRSQTPRFGPRTTEEEWPALMTSRKLFPLLATLRLDNGPQRFRFEVISVTREKVTDPDGKLFRPPADYVESRPLPF